MSANYAPPAGASATAAEPQTPMPALVTFAEAAPQARLTVLVRLIMALPQFVVLALLGVAAYVVTIIGWFAALFTGRLPGFAADFLTGYLRWMARVYAYAFLLTGAYPPFSLEDSEYPVRVAVSPGRLNRLAVLFRVFLLIPCSIVLAVVAYGAFTIVQVVSWLIVLISGKMPNALHQALSAILRYQLRNLAFGMMLTSAYPTGLFGESKYATTPWPLVLSDGAKKLVAGFIVLGVLFAAAIAVLVGLSVGHSGNSTSSANDQVLIDAVPSTNALGNYSANVTTCKGDFTCVITLDRKVAATLDTFARQLPAITMPSAQAETDDKAMATAVSNTAAIFTRLGGASSATQYISLASKDGLQQSVNQLNAAYIKLGKALNP